VFDVRRLTVLQEVARCGSLSAAAAVLNYTTSAVSQQISALEREIGVPLLVRGPTGARPTPAGARLLEHAGVILGAVEAAELDLIRDGQSPDVLRLASFASAATAILPAAIARFRLAHAQVRIQLIAADPDDGVALVNGDGADLAVITEVPGERPQYPGVRTVPVYDDEFFVVLPAQHRLAAHAEVPLSALADDEWVVSSATGVCPDTRVFRTACQQAGFTPSVTFRPDDYETVQGLVAANLGVSLVPSLALGNARTDVAIRRVTGHRPVRRIALAIAPDAGRTAALASLVSLIQGVGTQRANDTVCSFPARPFSVA
jgi:DNA-binding transcriptional LysR family regulator